MKFMNITGVTADGETDFVSVPAYETHDYESTKFVFIIDTLAGTAPTIQFDIYARTEDGDEVLMRGGSPVSAVGQEVYTTRVPMTFKVKWVVGGTPTDIAVRGFRLPIA